MSNKHDKTCMLVCGVDKAGNIFLVDCAWGRMDAQQQVEKWLDLMAKWKTITWWAESQHIGKAIGPFLRKRKMERAISGVIEEVNPTKDKEARARSVQGLMADGRVIFPKRAWWRVDAEDEVLKFPNASYDDFVDALSWLGLKLNQLVASTHTDAKPAPKRFSFDWWKKQRAFESRMTELNSDGGW
jgi:predicted phage terminase large subunit-like protein